MELPAAGLFAREHHVVTEPLQHGDGRPRRLGEERVAQTRDEEPDAHSRVYRAASLPSRAAVLQPVELVGQADLASRQRLFQMRLGDAEEQTPRTRREDAANVSPTTRG